MCTGCLAMNTCVWTWYIIMQRILLPAFICYLPPLPPPSFPPSFPLYVTSLLSSSLLLLLLPPFPPSLPSPLPTSLSHLSTVFLPPPPPPPPLPSLPSFTPPYLSISPLYHLPPSPSPLSPGLTGNTQDYWRGNGSEDEQEQKVQSTDVVRNTAHESIITYQHPQVSEIFMCTNNVGRSGLCVWRNKQTLPFASV